MGREAKRSRSFILRRVTIALGSAVALLAVGSARAEPPIKSPQDALCRAEAKARVFTVPDPQNVGLHEVGRRIYMGCMRNSVGPRRTHHRHHRRRHR